MSSFSFAVTYDCIPNDKFWCWWFRNFLLEEAYPSTNKRLIFANKFKWLLNFLIRHTTQSANVWLLFDTDLSCAHVLKILIFSRLWVYIYQIKNILCVLDFETCRWASIKFEAQGRIAKNTFLTKLWKP